MDIALQFIILIFSLIILVKASDYFTEYSERLGLKMGLSAFIIGATIMSVGTSMPEFITSMIATLSGDQQLSVFAIDNVIGSNIANSLLIIGIAALIVKKQKGLAVTKALIDVDLPFLVVSTGLFVIFMLDGEIAWPEGLIFVVLFGLFLMYMMSQSKKLKDAKVNASYEAGIKHKHDKTSILILLIIISGFFIFLGGRYTVTSVLNLAELMHLNTSLLTLIVVAIGTSLPEVLVSAMSAYKGNHAAAIGNAFGSNIFNILFVLSVPSFFVPLKVSETAMSIGLPYLILSILAAGFVTMDNKVRVWEGFMLIVIYMAFVGSITGLI